MDSLNTAAETTFTQDELGMLGELAGLMGEASSETLGMLVDQTLGLGEPQLAEYSSIEELVGSIGATDAIVAGIHFSSGFNVPVAFIIPSQTAITIADGMMGSTTAAGTAVTDIQMSALGEAVSQMMGNVANTLSQQLSESVDISDPNVLAFSADTLLALLPEAASDSLVGVHYAITGSASTEPAQWIQVIPKTALQQQLQGIMTMSAQPNDFAGHEPVQIPADGSPSSAYASMDASASYAAAGGGGTFGGPVVQPVEFPAFDNHVSASGGMNKNLELVMDVQLNLTVELGRSELPIKEVLELTRGSVVELNRVAGESVDLFANGKMIAKGEVVVIEDNFGLRITSIVSPVDRLRGL